jgi:hypothetical protein
MAADSPHIGDPIPVPGDIEEAIYLSTRILVVSA